MPSPPRKSQSDELTSSLDHPWNFNLDRRLSAWSRTMTKPLALLSALAILCAVSLVIPLCALIATWLGSVELTPWVFAAGCLVAMNWPERVKR